MSEKVKDRIALYLVVFSAAAAFLPVLGGGFVWDDTFNLEENFRYRGLGLHNLKWMFSTFHDGNYHPLSWLSLGVDYVLWGMNPAGYHLTNLSLHVVNALLFYFLIVELIFITASNSPTTTQESARVSAVIGTLFFAVHPLRVETVAWISTRADLLCGAFYLVTLIAYLRMNRAVDPVQRTRWYIVSIFFFLFSLLSRAWGITLPVVLLILDLYPLRRLPWHPTVFPSLKRVLCKKLPFASMSLAAGVLAIMAKKSSMAAIDEHGMIDRIMQSAYGVWFYTWKSIAPSHLSPLYLLKKSFNPFSLELVLAALAVLAISTLLVLKRKEWPWGITAWGCYVVVVSPLLGIAQSGPQLVADRYTYIACMPFAALLAAGMLKLWKAHLANLIPEREFKISVGGLLAVLLLFSVLSFSQSRIWHDEKSLWDHAVALDPGNYLAFQNRGIFYKDHGNSLMALKDYNSAIALDPSFALAYFSRGVLLDDLQNSAGAVADYDRTIQLNPGFSKAYNNRGWIKREKGDLDSAMSDFEAAIRLNPNYPEALANRAICHFALKDYPGALADFKQSLQVASSSWPRRKDIENLIGQTVRAMKSQETAQSD